MGFPAVGGVRTASRSRRSVIKKRGEADSEGRLERSEGKSPRPTQWDWVLPESQRKRPSALAASQRGREALSRREQRGWSAAKAKAQGPRSGTGFCLSRSEAARREQAQRDQEARRSGQRGRLERSEGKKPRFAEQICIWPKSQRKRPSVLAASQRDKEARRSGQRGAASAGRNGAGKS